MTEQVVSPERTPLSRTNYEPTASNGLSRAIVEAIADVERVSPMEIDPLYESVDLDALESFVRHAAGSSGSASVFVGLSLSEWDVLVFGDGRVRVHEPGTLECCQSTETDTPSDDPRKPV